MLALLALALYAGLLIFAAASDVASLTIPNWISLTLTGLFIVLALAQGMPLADIGLHLLVGFAVLAVGFFLFQAKILGGGDAKLLGAAAAWAGTTAFLPLIVWTTIAGGALAMLFIVSRKYAAPALASVAPNFVNRLLMPQSGLPYGVAIMIGGLMAAPALPLAAGALTLP